MKEFFVDCPTGLSGDMLLAAFFDLGVPTRVIESSMAAIGLEKAFALKVEESDSFGLRGVKVVVDALESPPPLRTWKDIQKLIADSHWHPNLREKVWNTFHLLAEAESQVHGQNIEDVHFHELGAIDSLVDVIGVCAAVDYLNPMRVICSSPPAGQGNVHTSHGLLPVPVPAVLEMARIKQIDLMYGSGYPKEELTTPTGLALMSVLSERFGQPSFLRISSIGVGLGHRRLDRPNLLRICVLDESSVEDCDPGDSEFAWQKLIIQEAWIDDASLEDIAALVDNLRVSGALDVISQPVLMKKGRQGVCITAIVVPHKANDLRKIWFSRGTTIGLRERLEGRWVLPRKGGVCTTELGNLRVKKVRRPGNLVTIKPEYDELLQLSRKKGISLEELRRQVFSAQNTFYSEEEWSWS